MILPWLCPLFRELNQINTKIVPKILNSKMQKIITISRWVIFYEICWKITCGSRMKPDKCQQQLISYPGLTWRANHTMHHKLPCKKTAYGNAITFLFFFHRHSMESLSAINLYGQLMTSMSFCMAIQWFSCSSLKNFPTNNFHFFTDIVPRNPKILKSSRLKGNPRQQLSEFNFPRLR